MHNLSVVLVDAAGGERIVLAHLTDVAIATDGLAAFLTASNADWSVYWVGTAQVQAAPAPSVALYQDVRDQATLIYEDAGGDLGRVTILAPKAALFLADQETVDPADPTGVIAQWLPILTTPSGNAVVAFVGGHRSRR